MLRWPFAVWYWAALLPLGAAVIRRRHGWLAAAFAISWVADTIAVLLPPPDRWIVSAVYPVSQAGLLYLVLASTSVATVLTAIVGIVAVLAALAGSWTMPDAALRLTVAVTVVGLIRHRADLGVIRPGLLIYFGGGTLCWFWLPFLRSQPELFVWPWLGYQGCRLVGLGYVTRGIWGGR